MNKFCFLLLPYLLFVSCREEKKETTSTATQEIVSQEVSYATGFTIENKDTYKEIKITSPWPDAKNGFTYILYPKGTEKPNIAGKASYIKIPAEKTIVTSTTDIPMLEYLQLEKKIIGFPHCDYISSEKTRTLIDNGSILELGNNGHLNTELTLELAPEIIIGYSATGDTKAYDLLEKTGIPVVMNGSWMEQHPLGRAEWIKFVAAFYNKEKEADSIFNKIEQNYTKAATLAKNTEKTPTVLSGNMFKDVWHVPGGNSYVAQFLKDANTDYLWKDTQKTGSIALNFESVLEKAQNAELWIGSGSSRSLQELQEKNNRYTFFEAFKNKTVYSSAIKTGSKGGLIYYELGPMRPDLILKDIIQIAHPKLLKDYEPYFFEKLN